MTESLIPVQKALCQPLFRGGLIAPTAFDIVKQIVFIECLPSAFVFVNKKANIRARHAATGEIVADGNKLLAWYTASTTPESSFTGFPLLRDGYINEPTGHMVSPPRYDPIPPRNVVVQTTPVPLRGASSLLRPLERATAGPG